MSPKNRTLESLRRFKRATQADQRVFKLEESRREIIGGRARGGKPRPRPPDEVQRRWRRRGGSSSPSVDTQKLKLFTKNKNLCKGPAKVVATGNFCERGPAGECKDEAQPAPEWRKRGRQANVLPQGTEIHLERRSGEKKKKERRKKGGGVNNSQEKKEKRLFFPSIEI